MVERRREPQTWVGAALTAVALVTAIRLGLLAYNRTDLFVDESQYWLWGRNLAFGYFSKPPLIGWLIGAVTRLAGSDAPFWVRMPGALLHGATAMILGALGARLFGARVAFWVALSYVTTPLTTVGSLLISTDTVMAPAYATALWAWFRLADSGARRFAVLAGAAAGVAFMAKYAGVYFLMGAGLCALFLPAMRIGWRNGGLLIATFAVVIAPNIVWNLTHGLATVHHTMGNIGLEGEDQGPQPPSIEELFDFVVAQFGVYGPILFTAFLLACATAFRRGEGAGTRAALVLFSLPIFLIICVQAYMSGAYANWAVATYFAGTLLTVPFLLARAPRLLPLSVSVNVSFALLLPVLAALAPWPDRNGRPLLHRYLGRADLSRQVVDAAKTLGVGAVLATDRDLLADLFYTGRASGLRFYAKRPTGRPANYYEQTFPVSADAGQVLYVLESQPRCAGQPLAPVVRFDTAGGTYSDQQIAGYLLPQGCADAVN